MKKITHEEFLKAYETVERWKYQQRPKTVQVSLDYEAIVSVTVDVPAEWSIDKIKKELKDGYYDFDRDDQEDIELGKIKKLIVNGEEIF